MLVTVVGFRLACDCAVLSKEPDEEGNVAVAFGRSVKMPVGMGDSVDLADAAVAYFGALLFVLSHRVFLVSLHGIPRE
jgi:hypothetical protein